MSISPTFIASRTNSRIKLLRAAFSGNPRLAHGLVAIEGENLLREAIRSGIGIEKVFVTERFGIPRWLPVVDELLVVSEPVLESALETKHPQGVAALLRPPSWQIDLSSIQNPLILVVDRLQDPGNLGALVRSAEAFSATAVLTTAGTVNPWNQKVVRASAGSIFRVPVVQIDLKKMMAIRDISIYAAVAQDREGEVLKASAADLTGPVALMIGNEGSGLDPVLANMASSQITIPMPGQIESLNAAVAGSLLLYEASEQRRKRLASHAG